MRNPYMGKLPKELETAVREFVRKAYADNAPYPWIAYDIHEAINQIIEHEVIILREGRKPI